MDYLYRVAIDACSNVYRKNTDLGTTEYSISYTLINSEWFQVLAIAGTNEVSDWFKNFNLWSKCGVKKSAYDSACKIKKYIKRKTGYKLLVTGHSKGGATAIAFKKLFGADACVAFSPARSLRYWTKRKLKNTTIFIDPDDPVSKLGFISFGHPICKIVKAKDDHFGLSVKDHFVEHWVEYLANI